MPHESVQVIRLRLRLLGEPSADLVADDGSATPAALSGKPLALLAFLAMAPRRTASRERLADLLWGHLDDAKARAQLRQALWLIRSQAGDVVAARGSALSLTDAVDIDAAEFERCVGSGAVERAVELYGGDFFAGFASPGTEQFEEWIEIERSRFRTLLVHAAELRVRTLLDAGQASAAAAVARRLREADPHGEIGWQLLVESQVAAGDSLSAKATADLFEEWLKLEQRSPDGASGRVLRLARRQPAPRPPDERSSALTTELVGREQEFAALHAAWTETVAGGARLVDIVGVSGIGKSRLVMDFISRRTAARERALCVRANAGERAIPFSFAAAVARGLAALPGARAVSPATAATLVSLDPALSSAYPSALTDDIALRSLRVGLALQELVAAIADEKPLLLVLDDCHWADEASREAVTILASRLQAEQVLLVATRRPHHAVPKMPDARTEIPLRPLTCAQVQQLVASAGRLPEEGWAALFPARLHECSGGSPLQVLELLRLALDMGALVREHEQWKSGDPAVLFELLDARGVITRRLDRLPASDHWVLRLLAVAARPASEALLEASSGLDGAQLAESLHRLENHGFAMRRAGAWATSHDNVEEHVRLHSEASDVARAHEGLGRALATGDSTSRRLAVTHLAHAGRWAEAANLAALLIAEAGHARPLDASIQGLLGDAASPGLTAMVQKRLPFRIRRPGMFRGLIAATILGMVAAGAVQARARPSRAKAPGTQLLVIRRGDAGRVFVRRIPLERSAWVPAQPIAVGDYPERIEHRSLSGPMGLPRPGHEAWVSEVAVQDSGELELFEERFGQPPRRLTFARGQDRPGGFSPDGAFLVFLTTRWSVEGRSLLGVLDLQTRAVRQLTFGEWDDAAPAWSPDGSRIAFVRRSSSGGPRRICVVDADGGHPACLSTPVRPIEGVAGWTDPRHALVIADSDGEKRVTFSVDMTSGATSRMSRPEPPANLPATMNGWMSWRRDEVNLEVFRVAPIDQPDLERRVVFANRTAHEEIYLVQTATPDGYLDRVMVEAPDGALLPRTPYLLRAVGLTRAGAAATLAVTRWRSLDTTVATIDSLGVLLPRRSGEAVVEVSAGGWRTSRMRFVVRDAPAVVILHERWENGIGPRWRMFGVPDPQVVSADSRHAFLNGGDGAFFSGAYLPWELDARGGLAVDVDVSSPVTATKWQVVVAGFHHVSDEHGLAQWDHRTGYPAAFLEGGGCAFHYPAGEGPQAVTSVPWYWSARAALGQRAAQLHDGHWYRLRMQLLPDGRCAMAIDGKPILIGTLRNGGRSVRVFLYGMSVGTRMLAGELTVTRGVPRDIDWSRLSFRDGFWQNR